MTAAELKVLAKVAPSLHSLVIDQKVTMNPPTVMRMACEHCFLNSVTGPAVEALRRAMRAFQYEGISRGDPAYEALLHFES